MPLFKTVFSSSAPDDSLRRYCPSFQPSMSFEQLRPIIEDAEASYIKPYLSSSFYEELLAAYEGGAPSADQLNLIRRLQRAGAWFTFFDALSGLLVSFSDLGPGEAVDKEGSFLFPRQWVTQTAKKEAWRKAHKNLDEALLWLEANAAKFPTWANDDEIQTKTRGLFFNSAEELSDYLPGANRIIFLKLKAGIREAEKRYILPTIGEELFEELKAAIKAAPGSPLSSEQNELIDYIRQALSKWMIILGLPHLRLIINEAGLVEPSFDLLENTRPPSEENLRSLWISSQKAGELFLHELKSWLDANADLFPTYKASSSFEDKNPHAGFIDQEDEEGRDYSVISLL